MKQLVEKLIALEQQISTEKGEFSLFALFLREDAQDKWDLVASAAWLEADKKTALDYLSTRPQFLVCYEGCFSLWVRLNRARISGRVLSAATSVLS